MSILRLLFYGATHTRPETRFSVSSGRIKIESSLLVKPYSNSKVIRLQGHKYQCELQTIEKTSSILELLLSHFKILPH